MYTRQFWLDTLERTLRTFVQAGAASLVVTGLDDWAAALKIALGAGVLAVATSLGASRTGASDSASLLPANVDPPQD